MNYEVISHLTHNGKPYPPGSIIGFDPEGKFAPGLLEAGVIRPIPQVEVPPETLKPEPSKEEAPAKKPSKSKKKAQASEVPSEDGKTPTGYCVKCKQMRKMVEAKQVILKNKKKALQGRCQACLTKITKMV